MSLGGMSENDDKAQSARNDGPANAKIQKFCQFMGLKSAQHIAPISRKILDEFACNEQELQAIVSYIKNRLPGMAEDQEWVRNFTGRLTPAHLEDVFFLTAAGAQLAYQENTSYPVSINRFFIKANIDQTINYGYIGPDNPNYPNSIMIGLPWIIRFCDRAMKASAAGATQRQKDLFAEAVSYCIKAGAEEAYHAFQQNHPPTKLDLVKREREKYGDDFIWERARRQAEAEASGNRRRFSKEDPAEIDADQFNDRVKYQVKALAEKYFANQVSR